ALCREYAARDSRVRYTRSAVNLGANGNFNRVVSLSSGVYFKLANADDVAERSLLARCVDVLNRHPEVGLCCGKATLIDESGAALADYDDRLDLRGDSPASRFRLVLERTRLVNALQGVTRAATLRRMGLLGRYPGADVALLAELALHGQFY